MLLENGISYSIMIPPPSLTTDWSRTVAKLLIIKLAVCFFHGNMSPLLTPWTHNSKICVLCWNIIALSNYIIWSVTGESNSSRTKFPHFLGHSRAIRSPSAYYSYKESKCHRLRHKGSFFFSATSTVKKNSLLKCATSSLNVAGNRWKESGKYWPQSLKDVRH